MSGLSDLAVVVACHDLICGIPIRWVSRLALREEVVELGSGKSSVIEVGGARYAGWDLGERLGLPPLGDAWVLLSVPLATRAPLPLALKTGACLVVEPLPERIELPVGLYTSRPGAVAGVFVAAPAHGALYGLELDIAQLWSGSELAASAALLDPSTARRCFAPSSSLDGKSP